MTLVLRHGVKVNGDEEAMLGTVCHVSKRQRDLNAFKDSFR